MTSKFKYIFLFCSLDLFVSAQNTGIKPQVWTNAGIAWKSNNGFYLLNTLSYNVLLSKEVPWNEFSNTFSTAYSINPYISVIGGFYVSRTRQSSSLSTIELRPTTAIRLTTNDDKRWRITNVSKFEFRFIDYTDDSRDNTTRFRNRTLVSVAVNRPNPKQDGSVVLYSYLEVFHNFEESTEERFFKSTKVKTGMAYRLSYHWRFDLGLIYLDATNTIREPSNLPSNIITNFIMDVGVYYIL